MTLVQLRNKDSQEQVRPYTVSTADLAPHAEAAPDTPEIRVEQHDDMYVASKPRVGALSVVDERDLVALYLFHQLRATLDHAANAIDAFYTRMGHEPDTAHAKTEEFIARLVRDGWTRDELPQPQRERLHTVYFTLTRRCDLACPYCYQGLAQRSKTDMTLEQAELSLDKIKGVNPNCKIIITGGEPFAHPQVFEILEAADARGFSMVILTNGTYIDAAAAQRLKALKGLLHVQLSLDGITEETHALTRGPGHFAKAMRAFDSIREHGLPFVLAPTMHNDNLHEVHDVAALAIANGGWCSPNNLREFPHEGLNFEHVQLSNDQCLDALKDMNSRLLERFGLPRMAELAAKYKGPSVCSVAEPNANFICGMAHSLMDLDWNGDLYPCHLTKAKELIIGNLFVEDFDTIFNNVVERGIRVESHDIPKCSGCKFVSTCGGGCRAGAWFTYGSLAREDGLCSLNYNSQLNKILLEAGRQYPVASDSAE